MIFHILIGFALSLLLVGRLLAYRSIAVRVIRVLTIWHGLADGSRKVARAARVRASRQSSSIAEVSKALVQLGAVKGNADSLARQAAADLPSASVDDLILHAFQLRGKVLAGVMSAAAEKNRAVN